MKDGMFESYTEAIGYLIVGAMIAGGIVLIVVSAIAWVAR